MRANLQVSCLAGVLTALASSCGSTMRPVNDAGPDTSCGLDCAAQARYGLTVNRCFEYTSDPQNKQDPPALGIIVLPVFTIDDGTPVLPVEYRQGGQIKQRDSFGIKDGALYLMRREFSGTGNSVTYRNASDKLSGVKWLQYDTASGDTFSTSGKAYVVNQSGMGESHDVTYSVSALAASSAELKTPLTTFDAGVKLVIGEMPEHGRDPTRVFVPDLGFVLVASPFSLTGTTGATRMYLQRVRDIGVGDAGTIDCGLAPP